MMDRIRAGEFTHLLVWKIDRISRNLKDFTEMWEELKEYNVTFISKMEQFDTSTAMGEAMLKIILVFAELERKLTAERIMSIMLSRAEKGLWNGSRIPFGYDWNAKDRLMIINEKEAKIVQLIYDLYEETGSCNDVLHYLELHNVPTKHGGKWTTRHVNDILRSPLYKGTLRYNYRKSGKKKNPDDWVIVENAMPAIVSTEQWERVQKKLDANYKGNRTLREKAKHVHIFSGLVRCADCDLNFLATLDGPRKDGYRPSIYRCRNLVQRKKAWCECKGYINDIKLGPFVFNYLANLVAVEELLRKQPQTKLETIEAWLLKGKPFNDIVGIETEGLSDTYEGILEATGRFLGHSKQQKEDAAVDFKLEKLKQIHFKYERALDRLERAYLFDDVSMSEKDYLIKRTELKDKLQDINNQIRDRQAGNRQNNKGIDFIEKASRFLVAKNLLNNKIDFRSLAHKGDKTVLRDFVQSVIEHIYIKGKLITAIRFKGGITHRFIYKDKSVN